MPPGTGSIGIEKQFPGQLRRQTPREEELALRGGLLTAGEPPLLEWDLPVAGPSTTPSLQGKGSAEMKREAVQWIL